MRPRDVIGLARALFYVFAVAFAAWFLYLLDEGHAKSQGSRVGSSALDGDAVNRLDQTQAPDSGNRHIQEQA